MTAPTPTLGTCPVCARRYLIVPHANDLARCSCGAELVAGPLPPGVHELRRPRRAPHAPRPPRAPRPAAPPTSQEADLGYGESHGYGPAHGGPTGPGDAPAPAPARDKPEPEGQSRS